MRQDKLTTKLQEALADAQSLAVGNDNSYIEPVHLLTALLNQDDGSAPFAAAAGRRQRRRPEQGADGRRWSACPRCPARAAMCRFGPISVGVGGYHGKAHWPDQE